MNFNISTAIVTNNEISTKLQNYVIYVKLTCANCWITELQSE
jgi:hypothetical protein